MSTNDASFYGDLIAGAWATVLARYEGGGANENVEFQKSSGKAGYKRNVVFNPINDDMRNKLDNDRPDQDDRPDYYNNGSFQLSFDLVRPDFSSANFNNLHISVGAFSFKLGKFINYLDNASSGAEYHMNVQGHGESMASLKLTKYENTEYFITSPDPSDPGYIKSMPSRYYEIKIFFSGPMMGAATDGPVVIYDQKKAPFLVGDVRSKLVHENDKYVVENEIEKKPGVFYHMDRLDAKDVTAEKTLKPIDFNEMTTEVTDLALDGWRLTGSDMKESKDNLHNKLIELRKDVEDVDAAFGDFYGFKKAWYDSDNGTFEEYANDIGGFLNAARNSFGSWDSTMAGWSEHIWDQRQAPPEQVSESAWVAVFNVIALAAGIASFGTTAAITTSAAFGLATAGFGNVGGIIGNNLLDKNESPELGDPVNFESNKFKISNIMDVAYEYAVRDEATHWTDEDAREDFKENYDDAVTARNEAAKAYDDLVFNFAAATLNWTHEDATRTELREALADLGFETRCLYAKKQGGSSVTDRYIAIRDGSAAIDIADDLSPADTYLMFRYTGSRNKDSRYWEVNDTAKPAYWNVDKYFWEGQWQDDNIA